MWKTLWENIWRQYRLFFCASERERGENENIYMWMIWNVQNIYIEKVCDVQIYKCRLFLWFWDVRICERYMKRVCDVHIYYI